VPITATRFPVKSTGSEGHDPVWNSSPRNSSIPSKCGVAGTESGPVAAIRKRVRTDSPRSVVTVQLSSSSSKTARATVVSKAMLRRMSSRSATKPM
jgi:hypothetical protein